MGNFPPLCGGLSVVQPVDYLCKTVAAVVVKEQWCESISASEINMNGAT
jgi:hypothetical protein